MLSRRSAFLAALIAPLTGHTQSWPSSNIRIVMADPPGGSTATIAFDPAASAAAARYDYHH
jgi:hypothetical protein